MTPYEVTGKVGLSHAGELSLVYKPSVGVNPNRYGVILAHGANGGAIQWNSYAGVGYSYFYWGPALARAGFTCIASDLASTPSQDVFGNDTGMSRMEEDRAALATMGCKPGKVLVVGVSHGTLMGQNYIRAHADRVAALVCALPLCDLQGLIDGNIAGFQSQANLAWSLPANATSGSNPLPTRASPANAANRAIIAASAVPQRYLYSSADTVTQPAQVLAQIAALRTANPALDLQATQVSTTLDHTGDFSQVWPYSDMATFLSAHA